MGSGGCMSINPGPVSRWTSVADIGAGLRDGWHSPVARRPASPRLVSPSAAARGVSPARTACV